MRFELLSVIMMLGMAQGLFLTLLLISKPTPRTANRLLAALMGAYSLVIGSVALEIANVYATYPHLLGTATALPFLYGPLHFLYAKYLISGQVAFKRFDLVHLLPFIAYILYLIPFYLESAAYKQAFFLSMQSGQAPLVLEIVAGLKGIHGLVYMGLTLFLLRHHRQRQKMASGSGLGNVNWLWKLTVMTTGIWMMNAFLLLSGWVGYTLWGGADIVVGVAVTIAIYTLGYIGLRQSAFFGDQKATTKTAKKYERSGLTLEQADQLVDKLVHAMAYEKAFRQSDLTLQGLAHDLSISPNHLSQVINERLSMNFFEMVNSYRIEEAKRRLLEPESQHLTILAIAYDVGFNSKSAFNAAFKKYTHQTPTQFRAASHRT